MRLARLLFCAGAALLGGCGNQAAPAAAPAPPTTRGGPDAPPTPATPAAPATPATAAKPDGAATPATTPALRVVVLSGGGHHAFAANLDALLAGLASRGSFQFTRLAIGPDAPDAAAPAPSAERAVLGSGRLRDRCDAILAYTQGPLALTAAERAALLAFVNDGGGFVGLHCAVDSYPGWKEYVELCGARFERHPPFGDVHVHVDEGAHPVMAGLPADWSLKDEFYHLQDWTPGAQTVLMSGISPEGGERRPVTWCKPYGKGRVLCCVLGHGPETHGDPRYQQLVAQALAWAAGR